MTLGNLTYWQVVDRECPWVPHMLHSADQYVLPNQADKPKKSKTQALIIRILDIPESVGQHVQQRRMPPNPCAACMITSSLPLSRIRLLSFLVQYIILGGPLCAL